MERIGEQYVSSKGDFGMAIDPEEQKLIDSGKFTEDQLKYIHWVFQDFVPPLTLEQVRFLSNPKYSFGQMDNLRHAFQLGLTTDQVGLFTERNFDYEQAKAIIFGFLYGLTEDQVRLYADPKLYAETMADVRTGFILGLSLDETAIGKHPKFNHDQLDVLNDGVIDVVKTKRLTKEQLQFLANPKFSAQRMDILRHAMWWKRGINREIALLSDLRFDDFQMGWIWQGMKQGLSMDQIRVFADPKFDSMQMSIILGALQRYHDVDLVKKYADPFLSFAEMRKIYDHLKSLTPEEIHLFCGKDLDANQINEILDGLSHGLSIEQVGFYADKKYNFEQMAAIRTALEHGLSKEQIRLVADPALSESRMTEFYDMMIYKIPESMGMTAEIEKDHSLTVSYQEQTYHFTSGDLDQIRSKCGGIEAEVPAAMGLVKWEWAKGKSFDLSRDLPDTESVSQEIEFENPFFSGYYHLPSFETGQESTLLEKAKTDLLGKQYLPSEAKTYPKDYYDALTKAFQKHCHGCVPKIIETIAAIGFHTGKDPDKIAKTFNVRAVKQMLLQTNDWAQAYIGSTLSPEDRNKFLHHPDRAMITKAFCGGYHAPSGLHAADKVGGYQNMTEEQSKAFGFWVLNHPTTDPALFDEMILRINDLDLGPDTTVDSVCRQIDLSYGKDDMADIKEKYGLDWGDLEYDLRHSYYLNRHNGQTARTLKKGEEPVMVSLGTFTCCCQKLGEAGESAMMYGLIHPTAGFWVIENDKGKVIAQAEIWEPYQDKDTIIFDNIEFADDRNISTVMDTLVHWCETSGYKNVIMGTGYNEINYEKFPDAPIHYPALSEYEVDTLNIDNENDYGDYEYEEDDEEDYEEGEWKGDTYFVKYQNDPYLYSDALKHCVYLKKDGKIPKEVKALCSPDYASSVDDKGKYDAKESELREQYREDDDYER
jgi:hypothetical protein